MSIYEPQPHKWIANGQNRTTRFRFESQINSSLKKFPFIYFNHEFGSASSLHPCCNLWLSDRGVSVAEKQVAVL